MERQNRVGWGGIALLIAGAAVVLGFVLAGGEPAATTAERIRDGEAVRIGYANEPPYGYLDTDTGRVTGEAPEIARVILARMGVERVETDVARFGELIPALQAGQIDIVAAGMYVTPARCKEVAFSNPTYRIGEALLVRRGNPLGLHAYEDVAAHATAKIGVMGGAVQHGYAKDLGVDDARIVVFEDYQTALVGLKGGRIDALGATTLTAADLLAKAADPELALAAPFRDPVIDGKPAVGYGAFAFRKEDVELRDEFNRELAEFLGTPEHLALVRPFGFGEATLPGGVTARELCGDTE